MAVSIKLPYKVKLSAGSGPCTHYIPVSYTSGARPYSATWFTSETEDYESMPYHQVVTPSTDYIYVVMEPGEDDTENAYYWNGNRYVTVGAESAEKTALVPPTVSSQTLYYDKDNVKYLTNYLTGFDSDTMVLSGIISTEEGNGIRNAGTYTAYVSLKDPTTNVWDLGDDNYTDADQVLSWTVNKKVVTLPVISGDSNMTYNGNPQGPNFVRGADAGYFSLRNGSAETGTDAGSYVTKYVLLNYDNMVWATAASGIENDESGNPTIYGLSWSIDKAVINVPSINGGNSFSYNGSVQGPTFNNWSSGNTQLDVSNVTATNVGNYTATFNIKDALKPNYEWVGGGNGIVSLGWSIEKIAATLSVSPTSWAPSGVGDTQVVTVTTNSDGVVSATSSDTNVVTVGTISNNTFTMTLVTKGSADVTVSIGAGTNWNGIGVENSEAVVECRCGIDIDSFPTVPSYNDLIEIAGAYYDGELDSEDLGKVKAKYPIGTTFTVSSLTAQTGTWDDEWESLTGGSPYFNINSPEMPAQTNVVFEIIDYEHDNLTDVISTGGKTKALFTIQQKDMVTGCNMYWNHTQGNASSDEKQSGSNKGGWQESAIRKWLNNGIVNSSTITSEISPQTGHTVWLPKSTATAENRVGYYQSLPSDLKAGIKPVEKITIKVRTNSSITASTDYTKDYIWLPSETEIYGSSSAAAEGTRYNMKYSSDSKCIKQKGGTNNYWWERSVNSSNARSACIVNSGGHAGYGFCSYSYLDMGVAPAFCI